MRGFQPVALISFIQYTSSLNCGLCPCNGFQLHQKLQALCLQPLLFACMDSSASGASRQKVQHACLPYFAAVVCRGSHTREPFGCTYASKGKMARCTGCEGVWATFPSCSDRRHATCATCPGRQSIIDMRLVDSDMALRQGFPMHACWCCSLMLMDLQLGACLPKKNSCVAPWLSATCGWHVCPHAIIARLNQRMWRHACCPCHAVIVHTRSSYAHQITADGAEDEVYSVCHSSCHHGQA